MVPALPEEPGAHGDRAGLAGRDGLDEGRRFRMAVGRMLGGRRSSRLRTVFRSASAVFRGGSSGSAAGSAGGAAETASASSSPAGGCSAAADVRPRPPGAAGGRA